MVRGEIFYNSPSDISWKLAASQSFNDSISCDSPDFVYNGRRNWYLQCFVHKNQSGILRSLRLICKGRYVNSESFTQVYTLRITDDNGADYWTSPLLAEKFGPDGLGTSQNICVLATDRHKDSDCTPFKNREWIFHLKFYTPNEPYSEAVVNLKEADSRPRTATETGTQTCSDGTVQLSQNFKDLLLRGRKTDVTLKVEGTEFKAHKVILSARSPVFEKMFDHDMLEETSGSVTITDCEPEDFRTFLLYLYTGKVENPTVKCSLGLYCLADKYNVGGLAPCCVQFLNSNFSVESFCTIVLLGLRHCDAELMTAANAFFAKNLKQIVGTEQWKSFNTENPAEANEILIKGLSQVILLAT